jgi:hypothetical protein
MKASDLIDASNAAEGAWDLLDGDQRHLVIMLVDELQSMFDGGDWPAAKQHWIDADLTSEERVAVWCFLGPKHRAYLKDDDRKYLQD